MDARVGPRADWLAQAFRRKLRNHLANLGFVETQLGLHRAASQTAVEFTRLADRQYDYETALTFHLDCIRLAEGDPA